MPRPGALKHAGQAIVGDAVKRVSYSRTGRHVAKIQQRHEVYPQWLRHRVSPPKRESMPVFMRGSTSAYLLFCANSSQTSSRAHIGCQASPRIVLAGCRAVLAPPAALTERQTGSQQQLM